MFLSQYGYFGLICLCISSKIASNRLGYLYSCGLSHLPEPVCGAFFTLNSALITLPGKCGFRRCIILPLSSAKSRFELFAIAVEPCIFRECTFWGSAPFFKVIADYILNEAVKVLDNLIDVNVISVYNVAQKCFICVLYHIRFKFC